MARKNAATANGADTAETFETILDRQWDEIPETQTLPTGSWRLKGRNATYQPAKGDGNPSILFVYSAQEPLDDVDEEALSALGDNYSYDQNRIFYRAWLETSADVDNVRKLLLKHGVALEGKTVKESLKGFRGSQVIANLGVRTYQNSAGEPVEENNPTNFAAVE